MSNFISIIEGAVPVDLCEAYIAKHKEFQQSSGQHGMQGALTSMNRRDLAFFFDRLDPYLSKAMNDSLTIGLRSYLEIHPALDLVNISSYEIKVQETKKGGGFHDFHSERGAGGSLLRELAWMVYLNDTPEGEGTTEFLELGLKVQPKQGTMVFFPTDWTHTHRGNPVYTCTKYIATGWFSRAE